MKKKRRQFSLGFTLVELMVALIVASVVLGAVATLAHATVCADEATEEMGREQAKIRHMNRRLGRLIQTANGVLSNSVTEILLWHDINEDGYSTSDELTRIRTAADLTGIEVVDQESYADCTNVQFAYDGSRRVTVWYDMEENGLTQTYTVTSRMRASEAHKLF